MRLSIILTLAFFVSALVTSSQSRTGTQGVYRVGYRFTHFPGPKNYNWRGSKDPTLSGIIWYPAESGSEEKEQYIGPAKAPLFYAGRAADDAKLAPAASQYPLVALSHGTGGSALQMAWLGTYLAAHQLEPALGLVSDK